MYTKYNCIVSEGRERERSGVVHGVYRMSRTFSLIAEISDDTEAKTCFSQHEGIFAVYYLRFSSDAKQKALSGALNVLSDVDFNTLFIHI